jgi:phosphonate transport system substrate-binding protein
VRKFRIPRWAQMIAVVAIAATAVTACSSSSSGGSGSSSSGTSAAGTGNTVNSTWPTTLTIGEVGEENSTSLEASLAPLTKLFKAKLGITLKVTTGTSYAAMIEAQQAGKAQLIEYGPFSYWLALQNGLKIENIGIPITAPGTDGGYYSEAVVNPKLNPGITSLKDFAGKKTCFSDPASTSGYLYPSYGLLQAGISPTTGVTPVFAGSDSTAPLDVAKGSCQVGFTNNLSLPLIYTQNHIPQSDIKIVWKSVEIPGSPIAASDSLPASLRSAMVSLLVKDANSPYYVSQGYCSSVSQCNTATTQWGFANPSVANYSSIANICKLTNSPSCKLSS